MIKYKVFDNETIAYFDNNGCSNLYTWMQSITIQVMKKLHIPKDDFIRFNIQNIARDILINKTNFYGIAKCSPDDYFDIDFGKEIAKQRLLNKFYKYRDKVLVQTVKKYSIFKEI